MAENKELTGGEVADYAAPRLVVRAKFRCTRKAQVRSASGYGSPGPVDQEEVTLSAVMGDENKKWSRYTPSGHLEMTITNPVALARFEVGKDYYLDFTPVEAAE